MEISKKSISYILLIVMAIIVATVVTAIIKPKMHSTFNIQKIIIKKVQE